VEREAAAAPFGLGDKPSLTVRFSRTISIAGRLFFGN
jgi:hypothetical protein